MAMQNDIHQASFPGEFAGKGFLSVNEFLRWAGISRFLFYKLVKTGQIVPRKINRRTVIPVEEALRWRGSLPEAGKGGTCPGTTRE